MRSTLLQTTNYLLTLKNRKAYIGIPWKYPENPRSKHESQTISIVLIKSGYRKRDTKDCSAKNHNGMLLLT